MRFRKKPVVIEAWREGEEPPGIVCVCDAAASAKPISVSGGLKLSPDPRRHIHTLEGAMSVMPDDWIIKGVKGEFYPCKPDIFAATYEPVGEGGEEKG